MLSSTKHQPSHRVSEGKNVQRRGRSNDCNKRPGWSDETRYSAVLMLLFCMPLTGCASAITSLDFSEAFLGKTDDADERDEQSIDDDSQHTADPEPTVSIEEALDRLSRIGGLDATGREILVSALEHSRPDDWPIIIDTFASTLEERRRNRPLVDQSSSFIQKELSNPHSVGETIAAIPSVHHSADLQESDVQENRVIDVPGPLDSIVSQSVATHEKEATPIAAVSEIPVHLEEKTSEMLKPIESQGIVPLANQTLSPVDLHSHEQTDPISSTQPPLEEFADTDASWEDAILACVKRIEAANQARAERGFHEDSLGSTARREVALRLLRSISNGGSSEPQLPIEGLDSDEAKFWHDEVAALVKALPSETRCDADISSAADGLENALQLTRKRAPLAVRNCMFVTKVRSWGVVEQFPDSKFVRGQDVIIYFELDNLSTASGPGGYRTAIETSLEAVNESGQRVSLRRFPTLEETCQSARRDYFARYIFRIPDDMTPGRHRMEVAVSDVLGGKKGRAAIDMEILSEGDERPGVSNIIPAERQTLSVGFSQPIRNGLAIE